MEIIEYEEIKLLKHSDKSTVLLVREKNEDKLFIKKVLSGQQNIYTALQNCPHPYLPKLYEVILSDDTTTVIEEYVEGRSLESAELSEKQAILAVKELCTVLEFLHEKDIIHRDIKPSNMILAADGHIRLIDFDAARMPKKDLEQDTRRLGTRGYAPPEQYGFAQTDARADIYSLGVTLEQLLGDNARKLCYKRIIHKCTNLNPDSRYQSTRQVKRAFSGRRRTVLYSIIGICLISILWYNMPSYPFIQSEETLSVNGDLVVLPAPENPHWNGETGIALWGNVPDSGVAGEVSYKWKLYRRDTATPPNLDETDFLEGSMKGNWGRDKNFLTYQTNIASNLWDNGFYYFAVAAVGDGVHFTDSPYVMSDAFEYTGQSAPTLPRPTGLAWRMYEGDQGREHYATWSNLDDYGDQESFKVFVYDQTGDMVMSNIWTKERILSTGFSGIRIRPEFMTELGGSYRFVVQVQTARPNEYRSSPMPEPVPEEYFSPWYYTS